MSASDSPPVWVYDYVTDKRNKIIALQYHLDDYTSHIGVCLANESAILRDEGLVVNCSRGFEDRESAMAHAWTQKDRFDKGLD